MRHATVNAIHAILGNLQFYSMEEEAHRAEPCAIVNDGCWFRACDWGEADGYHASQGWLTGSGGGRLRGGKRGIDVVLPTCPDCAVLVDMALEIMRPVSSFEKWNGSVWIGTDFRVRTDHENWLRTL